MCSGFYTASEYITREPIDGVRHFVSDTEAIERARDSDGSGEPEAQTKDG